jgi:hypothetical protein
MCRICTVDKIRSGSNTENILADLRKSKKMDLEITWKLPVESIFHISDKEDVQGALW